MLRLNYLLIALALILGLAVGYFLRGWADLKADQPPPNRGGFLESYFFQATANYCHKRLNEIGNGNFRRGLFDYGHQDSQTRLLDSVIPRALAEHVRIFSDDGEELGKSLLEMIEDSIKDFLGVDALECIEAIEMIGRGRVETFYKGKAVGAGAAYIKASFPQEVVWRFHYWTIENGDCVRKAKEVLRIPKGAKRIFRYDFDENGESDGYPVEVPESDVDKDARKIMDETVTYPGMIPWEGFDREKCCRQFSETTNL